MRLHEVLRKKTAGREQTVIVLLYLDATHMPYSAINYDFKVFNSTQRSVELPNTAVHSNHEIKPQIFPIPLQSK